MEPTGEHFTPLKTDLPELQINLDRYLFALPFLEGKTVIDLGCGAGLGTHIYAAVAKKVYAVDYDAITLAEAKAYPHVEGKIEFMNLDLSNPADIERLPEADVCVALEVLEHLENPALVLKGLKAKKLVFSLPLHALEVSSWHKFPINNESDVRKLISPYYDIGRYEDQRHVDGGGIWIRGEGVRLLS